MRIIGITGGIATGKSTLTKLLKDRGYKVIDADKIAREVVEKDKPAYKAIVEEFGHEILRPDGDLDRKALGAIVFKDKDRLEKLNSIIHSHIFYQIKYLTDKLSARADTVFLDIPLLFEVKDKLEDSGLVFDAVWLVYAQRPIQIERIIKRDKLSREDAVSRIDAQMDIEKKKLLASEILHNSGTKEELEEQLEKLLKKYDLWRD